MGGVVLLLLWLSLAGKATAPAGLGWSCFSRMLGRQTPHLDPLISGCCLSVPLWGSISLSMQMAAKTYLWPRGSREPWGARLPPASSNGIAGITFFSLGMENRVLSLALQTGQAG